MIVPVLDTLDSNDRKDDGHRRSREEMLDWPRHVELKGDGRRAGDGTERSIKISKAGVESSSARSTQERGGQSGQARRSEVQRVRHRRSGDHRKGHRRDTQRLLDAEAIQPVGGDQIFGKADAAERREAGDDFDGHRVIHAEPQEDQPDACDDDQRREQRQNRTQKWIRPLHVDLQVTFEAGLLRGLEQAGSRPFPHQRGGAEGLFVVRGISPHGSRPDRRANATSAKMTATPETTT